MTTSWLQLIFPSTFMIGLGGIDVPPLVSKIPQKKIYPESFNISIKIRRVCTMFTLAERQNGASKFFSSQV